MKSLQKYKLFIFGIIALASSFIIHNELLISNFNKISKHFQTTFLTAENQFNSFNKNTKTFIDENEVSKCWRNLALTKSSFGLIVIKQDSIVFWNDKIPPVQSLNLDSISSSENQIISLKNGIYLAKKHEIQDVEFITTLKIKEEYIYKNRYLKTRYFKGLDLPEDIQLSLHKKNSSGFIILNKNNQPIFTLTPTLENMSHNNSGLFLFLTFMIGIVLIVLNIKKLNIKYHKYHYPILLISLWYIFFNHYELFFFKTYNIFQPSIYASSEWIPNLGTLVTHSIFAILMLHHIISKTSTQNKISSLNIYSKVTLLYIIVYCCDWILISLVSNSSISLKLDEFFSLDNYSYFLLLLITIIFGIYYQFLIHLFRIFDQSKLNHSIIVIFSFGALYFLITFIFLELDFINAIWPVVFNLLIYLIFINRFKISPFTNAILTITLFSLFISNTLYTENEKNELLKRELYANQLITDQNPNTEMNFSEISEKIKTNIDFSNKLTEQEKQYSNSQILEDLKLSTYWERYKINIYIFNKNNQAVKSIQQRQDVSKDELDLIISQHGVKSEINSALFYVKDYFKQLSYVSKIELNTNTERYKIYLLLRSKKIPEQVGIPRFLLEQSANALEDLEDYSIARYSNQKLIMKYGDYNYPVELSYFAKPNQIKLNYLRKNKHTHYIERIEEDKQTIIISKVDQNFFNQLAIFSFLFVFFSLIVIIIKVQQSKLSILDFNKLRLSFKIQVVLLSVVLISFVIFSFTSGNFLKNQHNTTTEQNLKEKLKSVDIEVKQKIGGKKDINTADMSPYLQYILEKFSGVFFTDINIYNTGGRLLASSQPELHEKGLQSTMMDNRAFKDLHIYKKSEMIHNETIGQLNYLSAYMPLYNNYNELLGYLNLQHYAKQSTYESQINGYLMTLINLTVLFLVVTVIMAVFMANWITKPLRLIQESFRRVEFGKQNQPINYTNNDEIGALVREYNNKLSELELTAMELAQSERESTWREMAKQVAHEIKNPLTPMKLTLQHFQRIFDPKDPNAKEKIDKIIRSLIEQINGLTKITNEFSSLAKMPKPNEVEIDLFPIIENCIHLFQTEDVRITFESKLTKAEILADKDLIIRVFNNILKNGIQAMSTNKKGEINVKLWEEEQSYLIAIKDNGKGISKDIAAKIFVPNFTTKSTGAGLGLVMVKQIIDSHGGEIWFESEVNEGTVFFIQLKKKN